MNIYAKEFNSAVANVSKAVSKDEYRPTLCKIHIQSVDDGIMFESSDGFRIHRSTCYIIDNCQEFDILVDHLDKVPTDVEVISISIKDNKLVIYDKSYNFEQNEGKFLKSEEIFPKRNKEMCISFNAKYLKDALQQFKSGDFIELQFEQDFKTGGIDNLKPITIRGLRGCCSTNMVLPVRTG